MTTACWLYTLYDADDTVLYVGISTDVTARLRAHRREKPWFDDVARIESTIRPSVEAALEDEKREIRSRRPVHNVAHNGDTPSRTPGTIRPTLTVAETDLLMDEIIAARDEARRAWDDYERAQHAYLQTVAALAAEHGVRGAARLLRLSPARVSEMVKRAGRGPSGRGPGEHP